MGECALCEGDETAEDRSSEYAKVSTKGRRPLRQTKHARNVKKVGGSKEDRGECRGSNLNALSLSET